MKPLVVIKKILKNLTSKIVVKRTNNTPMTKTIAVEVVEINLAIALLFISV